MWTSSFKLLKEIISDNEEIIEKYQREQIEENLKKLKEKEEHGYLVYYVQRIKKWLKKNSFNLYVLFLFLGLVFLYFYDKK